MILSRRGALAAFALITSLIGAGSAGAVTKESVTFNAWQCAQTGTPASGTLRSYTCTVGGYGLGKITFSGDFNEANGTTNDFGTENHIQIKTPTGATTIINMSNITGYTTMQVFSGETLVSPGLAMPGAGAFEFRYYNTFDDAPTGGVADAEANVTFNFTDELPSPPSAEDLGEIGAPGLNIVRTVTAGQVSWFKFSIAEATGTKFFNIDTEGTAGALDDTEIGIFDSFGALISDDDDSGTGFLSLLAFGNGGVDGDLPIGTYYLAVGEFNTTFAGGFVVTNGGTTTDAVNINFTTDLTGGGGGGGTTVNPNGVETLVGADFSGGLSDLFASDDSLFCILSDDVTLMGEIKVTGVQTVGSFTTMTFRTETNAGRSGLFLSLKMKNFTTNQLVERGGGVAPTSDAVFDAVVSTGASSYTDENGNLESRIIWGPVNDEDPSQDGWLLCVDQAVWILE